MGFGVIRIEKGEITLLEAGLLDITATEDALALLQSRKHLEKLISKYNPEVLAIEKLYFAKNQKTALAVAHARGVVLVTAKEHGLIIREYSPTEVKMNLAGYGQADKSSVLKMVRLMLHAPNLKVIDDASDAIAIAIVGSREPMGR